MRHVIALPVAAVLSVAAVATVAGPAMASTSRPFTCTGTISRAYTKQTVTGILTGKVPSDVTVLDWTGAAQVSTAAPAKRNGWWGGYWKTTSGLNQWLVGTTSAATPSTFHLMLPDTRIGGTFTALLVTEFGPKGAYGNWQNTMDCTAG